MSDNDPIIPVDLDLINKPYKGLDGTKECWVVFGRGAFAFRFGPFTPPQAGAIMSEAVEREIACTCIMNCGPEIDWDLAKDASPKLVPIKEPTDL